jgi:hypothetical protein
METLNIRADAHASYALEQQGPASKIITPIPSSKVSLLVHNTTITSHYATHLRKAATRPALLQHCRKQYNWQESIFDSIDWKAHHGAIQKLSFAEMKFVTKFIHQHLAMGLIFHKINPAQSATCSSCQIYNESEAHLLQCPKRRDALEYFLNNTLGNFLEAQHTCPELTWCLRAILASHIRGTEPRFGQQHGRDQPKFLELILAQQAIGWDQLVQGRFANHWSRRQEEYLDDNNDTQKLDRRYYSGDIWVRKLISLIWTTVCACWDHRNSSRHGTNKEENHAIRRGRLLISIRALYKDIPLMLAADRDVLEKPIDDQLKKHPTGLESWLRRTCNIVNLSKADALAALKSTHKTITEYFNPRKKKPAITNQTQSAHNNLVVTAAFTP